MHTWGAFAPHEYLLVICPEKSEITKIGERKKQK
jgi:hypothetical protein